MCTNDVQPLFGRDTGRWSWQWKTTLTGPSQVTRKVENSAGGIIITDCAIRGRFGGGDYLVESYYPTIENSFSRIIKHRGQENATEIVEMCAHLTAIPSADIPSTHCKRVVRWQSHSLHDPERLGSHSSKTIVSWSKRVRDRQDGQPREWNLSAKWIQL